MIKIYGLHTPHFLKTVYAAEELGLQYQIVPIDLMKGDQKTPAHLERHPFGKVPALEHDGRFIFESNAIVRYMGNLAPGAAYPQAPMDRAQVDQWMEYYAHQAGRWCTNVWYQKCIAPKYFNEKPNEQVIKDLSGWLMTDMPVIDDHLGKNTYVAGDQFTLADVIAHSLTMGFQEAGLPLNDFKNFIRWFDNVENRPSYKRATAAAASLGK